MPEQPAATPHIASLTRYVNRLSRRAGAPDLSGDGVPLALVQMHHGVSQALKIWAAAPEGAVELDDDYADALAELVLQVMDHAGTDTVGAERFAEALERRLVALHDRAWNGKSVEKRGLSS